MLSVIMLSVVMLRVVMLSAVDPGSLSVLLHYHEKTHRG